MNRTRYGLNSEPMSKKGNSKIEALTALPGIGAATAKKLISAKIDSVSKVASAGSKKLQDAGLSAAVAKKVSAAAKAAEMSGFEKIANAIAGMFGGAGDQQSGQQREVVLKVNNNELGRVIVDVLNDKYGMNIAR